MTVAIFRRLNPIQKGLRVLAKYGANSHLWLPGVGVINGLTVGNYLDSAGTTVATVDNPVGLVKDLITAGAINASQATTANKPTLRRGVTNLLLNSATPATQNVTVAASPYTLAMIGTGSVAVAGTGSGTLNGGGSTITVLNFTPTAGTATFTPSGSVTSFGLFTGTLTAAQIQACGGIPLTTSAAASSSAGNWGWGFNGATSTLALASVPFQMSDDHVIVAGARCDTSATGSRTVYGQAVSSGSTEALPFFGFEYSTKTFQYFVQGGGTTVGATGSVPYIGAFIVGSARSKASSIVVRVNSVQVGSTSLSGTYTTANASAIGCTPRSTPTDYMLGMVAPLVIIKGTVSDSDLLAIERMIGALTGPTGVTF